MAGLFDDEDPATARRVPTTMAAQVGPGGIRYPALLIATLCIGVAVAPIGAGMAAIIAYLSSGWEQKSWRGAFIILTAVFAVTSFAELYLLSPGEGGEAGPPGGGGITG